MKIILLFISICFNTLAFSQKGSVQLITVEEGAFRTKFTQFDRTFSGMGQLKKAVSSSPEAASEVKDARLLKTISLVTAFSGGYLLGRNLSGANSSSPLLLSGLGLVVASVPMSKFSENKALNAVDIFNKDVSSRTEIPNRKFNFTLGLNAVSLQLFF